MTSQARVKEFVLSPDVRREAHDIHRHSFGVDGYRALLNGTTWFFFEVKSLSVEMMFLVVDGGGGLLRCRFKVFIDKFSPNSRRGNSIPWGNSPLQKSHEGNPPPYRNARRGILIQRYGCLNNLKDYLLTKIYACVVQLTA